MGFSCLKRRNAQTAVRRAIKRNKTTDGFFGSSIVYIKCLLIWAVLLAVDYLLDFRFEYLWPVWMMLRSVYDSFKFQGAVLATLFGGLAIASDVVCYMIVPAHCLFFIASSYVWVQYISHTERGVCLPTVTLWLIYLYIEYTVRLRDVKQSSMSFTLDLCRPFAAHCVGYPVVTLGFGCKSYIQYRLRLKKQSQVRKQNDQYFDMMKQALPIELQQPSGTCLSDADNNNSILQSDSQADKLSECGVESCLGTNLLQIGAGNLAPAPSSSSLCAPANSSNSHPHAKDSHKRKNQSHATSSGSSSSSSAYMQLSSVANGNALGNSRESSIQRRAKGASSSSSIDAPSPLANGHAANSGGECNGATPSESATSNGNNSRQNTAKDDLIGRLESELRRLRSDWQTIRYTESELRSQISIYEKHEREARETMQQLRHERDTFETKLNSLQQKATTEKQALERQLRDERRSRQSCDEKLSNLERDRDELRSQLQSVQATGVTHSQQNAAANANTNATSNSSQRNASSSQQQNASGASTKADCCNGDCRNARKKLDNENRQLREQVARKADELVKLDNEKQSLIIRQSQADSLERELKQAQERASHLEKTLSDENRVKMDLLAALGDAKRQLEIEHCGSRIRDQELAELKRAHEFISTLLPGLNLSGMPVAHVLADAPLQQAPSLSQASHYLASQNGTSFSSPSSTPLSFTAQSGSYSAASGTAAFNTVSSSAYPPGMYQNAPSVYNAFGTYSPFGVAPSPSPTAFSPSVSAAIEAQQRAQSPSVGSATPSGDASGAAASAAAAQIQKNVSS